MYSEWISFRGKSRPEHVAVVVPAGPVRYGEFVAQIDKVAARLAALGIRAGGTVAVHLPDEYLHWLFVLALDRLGLASVSIGMPSPQHPLLMALRPDLVVTNAKAPSRLSFEAWPSLPSGTARPWPCLRSPARRGNASQTRSCATSPPPARPARSS